MFKFKRKTKPEIVKTVLKQKSTLRVHFNAQTHYSKWVEWTCELEQVASKLRPWKDFIKWYHCRPQSSGYTIFYQTGQTHILRAMITGYSITSREA